MKLQETLNTPFLFYSVGGFIKVCFGSTIRCHEGGIKLARKCTRPTRVVRKSQRNKGEK